MASDDGDREWQYAVDEVGEDADPEDDRRRIEPESVTPENALFVLVGVLLAIGALAYGLGLI
ncbi:DUF7312 domain-containing protein [Halalkalicoccus jeotgali]|uniref:DUF7312 domain-containing protein n=1 Tax=Halalkalicoccus jeotgali (strain DSM 18796 / CECT 7217 / JCM 14584 / KCTC 4019 / B3) TaxID=795797 RepID=D8J7J1_HALJB|nr:hypothetical protein [Halalkalicoccus jeotgali]ADJ16011.1 hypothetical protein HacjB3_13150 [Halalkalicoccus jeotgali B3]ELY38107.1 hypothetical protein C497_08354 [Halalkalicoccus jeotgali B3]